MNRIKQLLEFLTEDPDDPFTLYALATEYLNIDLPEAKKYFEILLDKHPGYIATYYHAGKLYEELDEVSKAISTYEKGIELAKKTGEQLALRELNNAYQELLME